MSQNNAPLTAEQLINLSQYLTNMHTALQGLVTPSSAERQFAEGVLLLAKAAEKFQAAAESI